MSTKPRQNTHCVVCGNKLPRKRARYCSPACSDKVHKHNLGSPIRRDWTRGTFGEQPMPPHDEIMKRLVQFWRDPLPEKVTAAIDETEKHPALHIARLNADALIIQRGGKLPRIREQYISKAWTEKEQAS